MEETLEWFPSRSEAWEAIDRYAHWIKAKGLTGQFGVGVSPVAGGFAVVLRKRVEA